MLCTHQMIGTVTVAELRCTVLDQNNAAEVERALLELAGEGADIVLDLGRVQWMDSAGCCALIGLLRRLGETAGSLKLCCLTPTVRTLFQLIRMHRLVEIFNSAEEAVRVARVEDSLHPGIAAGDL
jgi:anti-sigma B factor antagonist